MKSHEHSIGVFRVPEVGFIRYPSFTSMMRQNFSKLGRSTLKRQENSGLILHRLHWWRWKN
jgi:hypothetical protein